MDGWMDGWINGWTDLNVECSCDIKNRLIHLLKSN